MDTALALPLDVAAQAPELHATARKARPAPRCACDCRIRWSAARGQWLHNASESALCRADAGRPRGSVATPTQDVW